MASFLDLPNELLENIFSYLPATTVIALGVVNQRLNTISNTPSIWRRYVVNGWKYWKSDADQRRTVNGNPLEVRWRSLYHDRSRKDREALQIFDNLLSTQQSRIVRMEEIVALYGHDAKDLLLGLSATPDEGEDVLARRYYSDALLGLMHRQEALHIWSDMQYQDYPRLEKCLGAFDIFIMGGRDGGEQDLDDELDRIAETIRKEVPTIGHMRYTDKASAIAAELRKMNLLGSSEEEYHDLRNNFILHVLRSEHKVSLPLVSTAIYCCVAQRFGLRAWPCNFPFHIHAVIESPDYPPLYETRSTKTLNPGLVWMDPWRHDDIIDLPTMRLQLSQIDIRARRTNSLSDEETLYQYLSPALTRDLVYRTGRNIVTSVNTARENREEFEDQDVDIDAAFYSFLWSAVVLGWNDETHAEERRQYVPYLLDRWTQHWPEDVGLIERFLVPLYHNQPAHSTLIGTITEHRVGDRIAKPINHRVEHTQGVNFRVGQPFRHKRFGYYGIIVGWDPSCRAGEDWMQTMRIDALPKGRTQSFYHIMSVISNFAKQKAMLTTIQGR